MPSSDMPIHLAWHAGDRDRPPVRWSYRCAIARCAQSAPRSQRDDGWKSARLRIRSRAPALASRCAAVTMHLAPVLLQRRTNFGFGQPGHKRDQSAWSEKQIRGLPPAARRAAQVHPPEAKHRRTARSAAARAWIEPLALQRSKRADLSVICVARRYKGRRTLLCWYARFNGPGRRAPTLSRCH